MERSQSCTNFTLLYKNNDMATLPHHCKLQTSLSSSDLLKILHQKHLQRLQRAVSSDKHNSEINQNKSNATATTTTSATTTSSTTTLARTTSATATAMAMPSYNSRRKRLQRQKSTIYSDGGDELAYAADLEEDDDDDDDDNDNDHVHNHVNNKDNDDDDDVNGIKRNICGSRDHLELMQPNAAINNFICAKKKQVRFRQKQQSESSLLTGLNRAAINSKIMKCFEKCGSSSSLNSNCTTSTTISGHERRLKSDGSYDSVNEQYSLPLSCGSGSGSGSGSYQMPSYLHRHHHNQCKHYNRHYYHSRDSSIVHSDSSHYSSVDSLLEARKPDPEAILINLGFGPIGSEDILSRIPKRFLKPSQVRGIDTEAFIKRLQLANSIADHSVLGYRGLTGNPDQPPSHIVAKIMQRFEVNERKKSLSSMELKLR